MKALSNDNYVAFIGIDWADQKHDICLQIEDSDELLFSVIESKPEAVHDWVNGLYEQFNGQPVAIATELTKGPLVSILLSYEWISLYVTHPTAVAKYRAAFTPSRAKSDPKDAETILEMLRILRHKLRKVKPQSASIRALNELVTQRRKFVQQRVDLSNRIVTQLKLYFPQALDIFSDRDTLIFCDFLEKWPTLAAAKSARSSTLIRFFEANNARQSKTNQQRIEMIKNAMPVTDDRATLLTSELFVRCWMPQLRGLIESIHIMDDSIKTLYKQFEDRVIFDSLPGAGPQLAPRLLAAFGTDRERFNSASDVQKYSGIAPVIETSGKKHWTHWRFNCATFTRQTFVEWAGQSIRFSRWAKAYYQLQLKRGKTHHVAVRALAYKWIRVAFACWKTRTPYDENAYIETLKNRGSELVNYM